MKKIISLVLTLVMLVSVLAVLPVAAEDNDVAVENFALYLDSGINLVFLMEDGTERIVPVAAKEMGDEITVGNEGYCVSWAAQSYIDPEYSEATQKLAEALLNYGAAAQLYFDHNADDLVGDPVTDTTALKGADVTPATVTDEAGIFIGATLILEGTLKLRFYFAGTEITATVDGEAATATAADGYSYVDVDVMPYNISKAVAVKVGNTAVSYAPINYLKNKADDTALSTMVASIYAYGVAAEAYYAEASACKHEGIVLGTVKHATVFTEGLMEGTCPECGEVQSEVVPTTKANLNPVTTTKADDYWIYDSKKIGDIMNGAALYPTAENPNGNDLFIEYSILLNGTMDMLGSAAYTLSGVYTKEDLSGKKVGNGFYYLTLTEDHDYMPKGSFEIFNSRCNEVDNGYVFGPDCDSKHLYIGNFDGWHRIGIRIHCEAIYNSNTKSIQYIDTVTLYIDGNMVHSYKMLADEGCTNSEHTGAMEVYPTIWAGSKNNAVDTTSYENWNSRYVSAYRYTPYLQAAFAGETAYFPVADIYYSYGDSFVLNVSSVENPEAQDFTQDGVTLSGKQYFTVNN